MGGNPNPTHGQ
ncbi:unnamed protein product, partial [Rotaria sp. Silwood1]